MESGRLQKISYYFEVTSCSLVCILQPRCDSEVKSGPRGTEHACGFLGIT